ncbi:MAG: hypothetical protein IPK82_10750 [Polyangiaceae bacterium]|nr:hypothetical protein [Polyangiaceae bacterium]
MNNLTTIQAPIDAVARACLYGVAPSVGHALELGSRASDAGYTLLQITLRGLTADIWFDRSTVVSVVARSADVAIGPYHGHLVWVGRDGLIVMGAFDVGPVEVEMVTFHQMPATIVPNLNVSATVAALDMAVAQDIGIELAKFPASFEMGQ